MLRKTAFSADKRRRAFHGRPPPGRVCRARRPQSSALGLPVASYQHDKAHHPLLHPHQLHGSPAPARRKDTIRRPS